MLFWYGARQGGEGDRAGFGEGVDERIDDARVELAAAVSAQLRHRLFMAHANPVGPVRRHGIIGVGHGDQAGEQRDRLASQPVGVA